MWGMSYRFAVAVALRSPTPAPHTPLLPLHFCLATGPASGLQGRAEDPCLDSQSIPPPWPMSLGDGWHMTPGARSCCVEKACMPKRSPGPRHPKRRLEEACQGQNTQNWLDLCRRGSSCPRSTHSPLHNPLFCFSQLALHFCCFSLEKSCVLWSTLRSFSPRWTS